MSFLGLASAHQTQPVRFALLISGFFSLQWMDIRYFLGLPPSGMLCRPFRYIESDWRGGVREQEERLCNPKAFCLIIVLLPLH